VGNVRSGRDIDASLRKKGCRCDVRGKHIWYFFRKSDGSDSRVATVMSHGMMGSTVCADLIGKMARQLRLTKTQFLDLIDCRLSEKDYRQILQNYDEDV
jgi:hypothetical protein